MWAKHTRTTSASSIVPFATRHRILSPRPMLSPPVLVVVLIGRVRLRQWAGSDTRTPQPAESSTVSREGPGQLGHVRLREMRRTSPCLKEVLEFWTVIDSIGKGRRTSVRGVGVRINSADRLRTEEYTLLNESERWTEEEEEHVNERVTERESGRGTVAAADNASEAEKRRRAGR